MSDLTQEYLKTRLHYDPDTGLFTWLEREVVTYKDKGWNTRRAGKSAGTIDPLGYRNIAICPWPRNLAHRLAWLYVYGHLPRYGIDHINGVTDDNRIINLRDVPQSVNLKNQTRSCNNTSGCTGVGWRKSRSRWRAFIHINGKMADIGEFIDKADAVAARKAAEHKHGYHENHGRPA